MTLLAREWPQVSSKIFQPAWRNWWINTKIKAWTSCSSSWKIVTFHQMSRRLLYRQLETYVWWLSPISYQSSKSQWVSWSRLERFVLAQTQATCKLMMLRTFMICEMLWLMHSLVWSTESRVHRMAALLQLKVWDLFKKASWACSFSSKVSWASMISKLTQN